MPSAALVEKVSAGAIMCALPTMPVGGDGGLATGHSSNNVVVLIAPAGTKSERWHASTQTDPPSDPIDCVYASVNVTVAVPLAPLLSVAVSVTVCTPAASVVNENDVPV